MTSTRLLETFRVQVFKEVNSARYYGDWVVHPTLDDNLEAIEENYTVSTLEGVGVVHRLRLVSAIAVAAELERLEIQPERELLKQILIELGVAKPSEPTENDADPETVSQESRPVWTPPCA